MDVFNNELRTAGVLQDRDGLRPSCEAKRVHFDSTSRGGVDGPFTGDLVASYWIWELPFAEEAVLWLKCGPNAMPAPPTPVIQNKGALIHRRAIHKRRSHDHT